MDTQILNTRKAELLVAVIPLYQQLTLARIYFRRSIGSTHQNVYTDCIYRGCAMKTAKVFRSGNSQAVRLPKEFRLKSKEVEVFRRGNELVLREKDADLSRAFELIASLPIDFTTA